MKAERRVPGAVLRDFYVRSFLKLGLSEESATIGAEGIHYADLRGIDTHGVANFKRIYYSQLKDGSISSSAVPAIVARTQSTAVVDANNALGYVAAFFGIGEALDLCRANGVSIVTVRDSSHCGCMGYYALQAANHGYIGLALTNLGAQAVLPPPGSTRPILGTNVIAAAVPSGKMPPFVIDMSTAVVSSGQIRQRRSEGGTVPPGWLRDANGASVTDPEAFFRGEAFLQFLGSWPELGVYKGFGLAMLIDILCGILSGGATAPEGMARRREGGMDRYDSGIGHCFIVIDPNRLVGLHSFDARVEAFLQAICACPTPAGLSTIYPGLPEYSRQQERMARGIPISDLSLFEVLEISRELSLDIDEHLRVAAEHLDANSDNSVHTELRDVA